MASFAELDHLEDAIRDALHDLDLATAPAPWHLDIILPTLPIDCQDIWDSLDHDERNELVSTTTLRSSFQPCHDDD